MGYKILIADNNIDYLDTLEKQLQTEKEAYKIIKATHQEEIFFLANNQRFDAFIINHHDERFNAFEIIYTLKGSSKTRGIPLLFITDYLEELHIENIFDKGIMDVLFRPFKPEEFSFRLKLILSRSNYFNKFISQAERIEQIANIISKSSNSVAIISTDGRIEWVNNGFELMYEFTFKEFKKLFEDELFHPDKNSKFKEALSQSIHDKTQIVYENKWVTKSGQEKWIQTTLTPVFNDYTNEVSNVIAIESDVSSLKKAEAKLEEQNKYLLKFTRHLETTNEILEKQRIEIEEERKKTEELLLNIFPYTIAKQLKSKGEAKLKTYRLVSVMFTDFKGFTKLSQKMDTQDLIKMLNSYFEKFDEIISNHYIEKIKTIGDAYMCAGGLPLSNKSNPIDVVLAGLEIQYWVEEQLQILKQNNQPLWEVRLGIHSGDVIAGVIGKKKFAYDIWGDCVNTASRMETSSEPGKVNVSGITYQYIKDYFDCTYRGKIEVKNKGEMEMYYVNRLLPEYSEDEKGIYPNSKFRKILASY